ncbi:DUF6538 domain-containing protein [Solirhodobacter olei]|uniref:DUF6538 domain-containing protein n=1 Tax=Solirhodobacter olei TaxID=2493082 RepID=UPI000FD9AD59|nr:DUF6538 domain-containing protein [Solirhodobacter olei]
MNSDKHQKAKYLKREEDGYWRYIRRVPIDLQQAIGAKRWRRSLSQNRTEAERRAQSLRVEHDALIARLRDPETATETKVELARRRTQARMADLEAQGAPSDGHEYVESVTPIIAELEAKGEPVEPSDLGHTTESLLGEMWRRVPEVLLSAEDEPDRAKRYHQLVGFQVMAFGDQSRGSVDGRPDIPAPDGKVARMQYDAHRAMLESALEEIAPLPDDTPPERRLSGLLKQYIKAQALRPNSQRSYEGKIKRFLRFASPDANNPALGDHSLPSYTPELFREYRDYLRDGDEEESFKPMNATSVRQYFAPMKALWTWAADEYQSDPTLKELSFPRIRMPKDGETVEEKRWQSFDDNEIKQVWKLLNEAWGPDGDSRLSPTRRKAFLMAFRVILWTGMRPVEVFRLTADNVKSDAAHGDILHITHTKTKMPRKVPIAKGISDLPNFLASGGFAGELANANAKGGASKPGSLAGTMRDQFRTIIRDGGLTNRKHVLYSAKDTLVERLQRQNAGDDVIRSIIGHVTGQKSLRNYKTLLGDTADGMMQMRKALNQIEYW